MKTEICTDKKIDKNNELYSLLSEKNIINNDFTMKQFFGNSNVMELFIEKLVLFDIRPAELFETSFEFTDEVTSNDLFNIIYIIRINQLIKLCQEIPEQTKNLLSLLENEDTNLIDIHNMDFNENKSGFNVEGLQDIENITNAKDLEQCLSISESYDYWIRNKDSTILGVVPGWLTPIEITDDVLQGNIDAISDLIIKDGFDVNLQAKEDGKTLLMQAAYLGREKMVLFLLKHGADVTLKDKNGETAIQKCRRAKLGYEFCFDCSKTEKFRNIIKHLNEAN